jgi:hypothetical protein
VETSLIRERLLSGRKRDFVVPTPDVVWGCVDCVHAGHVVLKDESCYVQRYTNLHVASSGEAHRIHASEPFGVDAIMSRI